MARMATLAKPPSISRREAQWLLHPTRIAKVKDDLKNARAEYNQKAHARDITKTRIAEIEATIKKKNKILLARPNDSNATVLKDIHKKSARHVDEFWGAVEKVRGCVM